MRNFIQFTLSLLLFVIASCNSDIPCDSELNHDSPIERNVGLSRAIEIAEYMITASEGENATRCSRIISSVTALNLTRSSNNSTNWYIVNYDNNQGFAIVTDADFEIPVAGFSSEGNLHSNDTINNLGLRIFLSELINKPDYSDQLKGTLANSSDNNSSTRGIGDKEPWPGTPTLPHYTVITSPILTPTVSRWHQGPPFNMLSPKLLSPISGAEVEAPVGCVPLAMMMIMSYFRWPESYYSDSINEMCLFDWDIICTKEYKYVMSRILRELARPKNLDVTFKIGGSPAKLSNVPRTFKNFKYSCKDFIPLTSNIPTLQVMLRDGIPALVSGINSEDKGHLWVIDGHMQYYLGDLSDGVSTNPINYFHCVWGWGGSGNGYFFINTSTNPSKSSINPGEPFEYDDTKSPHSDPYTDLQFMQEISPIY